MSSNIVVFAFTYVLENFALLHGDIGMNLFSVKDNKATKPWSMAMKRYTLYRFNFSEVLDT